MDNKNEIEVVIGGEVYKLISDESQEYVQRVANYMNKKIAEIYQSKNTASIHGHLRTLFISINIADELLKEKEKCAQFEKDCNTYFAEFTRIESENHILKQRVKELQKLYETCQGELESYIENFDKTTPPKTEQM